MKKIATMMLAAGILAMSAPAFAADADHDRKNECLIASHGCATRAKSINEQLVTLQGEIKKGTKVYSKEELDKLSGKLKDVEETLHTLLKR